MCQPDKIVVDTYRKINGGAILFNPEAAKVIENAIRDDYRKLLAQKKRAAAGQEEAADTIK